MRTLKVWFTPNEVVGTKPTAYICAGWFTLWMVFWLLFRPVIFPTPVDIVAAIPDLFGTLGFGEDLWNSFLINLEALSLAILIAMPISYLSRVPVFRPLAHILSTLRFLTPMVFFAILVFELNGGHQIKVAILTFGEAFSLVTSMVGVVADIPNYKFDHARTLRMSEWRSVWYVVIRGTLPHAFDCIQGAAAAGWAMLMMVEGAIRMEGGVGVILANADKHLEFQIVWLVSLILLTVGFGQDILIKTIKRVVCPYEMVS